MEYKKFYLLIIVCLFSIGIFAQSGTEKISISFSKIPLKEAMARVEKASGYLFSYDATEINAEQLVSLNCKNEEVRLALRKMFEPTNITFKFQLVCCFAVPVSFGTTAKYAWFFISYTLLNGVFYT